MTYVLWVAQVLLALVFLFAGAMKFVMPMDEMMAQMPMPMPAWFVLFIGAAEVLGGLGLILPGLLRIKPGLTPLAAAGLTLIMLGAAGYSIVGGQAAMAVVPLVVGVVAAFVAYGRWRLAPLGGSARSTAFQPAGS